jgi:small subunit ribosomal protein S10
MLYPRLTAVCSALRATGARRLASQAKVPVPDKLFKTIDIELRAHEPAVLKSFSWFACTAARELAVPVERSWAPEEPHKQRKTLLRAAFVNKKHRVQYEMRTFYHFLTLKRLTGSTADTYLEYVERNLPEGVSMKVIRHEVQRLPAGLVHAADSPDGSQGQ